MKKIVSSVLAGLMMFSSTAVFASVQEVKPVLISAEVPVAISVEMPFKVDIDGDIFKLSIEENASTGYAWVYKINKEDHVSFLSTEYKAADTTVVGASGERVFEFEVKDNGVSTITLTLERSWEKGAAETIEVLVYKNADKVFIEEDQIITIDDGVHLNPPVIEVNDQEETEANSDMEQDIKKAVFTSKATKVEDKWMLPLRESLESLGYTITWNGETQSIDIQKGAQRTSVKIGDNNYFKNRMAPRPLSAAPAIVEGKTVVPVEFFAEILDLTVQIEEGAMTIQEGMATIHRGFVKEVKSDETGRTTITLTKDMDSTDIGDLVVIHTSSAYTYVNTSLEIGNAISVVSPMMMTMSLPGQTSGYIVY